MGKRKMFIFFLILFLMFIIVLIFLFQKTYKNNNFGNNINNKNSEEIKNYILSISSYEAQIEVEVKSNKNHNKYIMNQKYAEPNIYKQEILEPSNIKNLIITYDGKNLKIENSKINLNELYENYNCITENFLYITSFVENYKKDNNSICIEENNQIIMEANNNINNKYATYKKLYINKADGQPIKMEILDINKNIIVNIKYNEIKINNVKKEDVLAFKLYFEKLDI